MLVFGGFLVLNLRVQFINGVENIRDIIAYPVIQNVPIFKDLISKSFL